MADEKITIATAANYWISQNALSIQLNALGEADRIQAGVASGAEIMVFIRGVKPASSGAEYDKNGDGLEYDNGHNYRHWPLTISPTYFNDSEVRYLYVAVPRSASVGTEAMVVFPSKKLDIYGYEVVETTSGQTTTVSRGTQLGSDDYFYIWLQAVISAVQTDKTPKYRKWLSPVEPGYLNSDEAYSTSETSWYRWDPISQIVTFTKEIWMDAASWFQNLQAVDGLFKGQLTVRGLFDALMAKIDKISSHDYVSGLLDGSGWRITNDNGEGGSELEVDFLKVRKKATFMELEVRKETFVGGNQHYSPAGSIIYRVDYMDANDQALGYVSMKVPWMLKGFAFLGKDARNWILNYAAKKKVRRGLTDDEWPKVKYFRCYLLADDGTTATRNWWRAGDQVRCQTWNKAKSGNKSTSWSEDGAHYHYKVEGSVDATVASNTYYWRMVNKVGSARLEDNKVYDYIDLLYEGWQGYDSMSPDEAKTVRNSFRATGSDKPDAGDMIVCMGNRYDENRMNMISLYTTGNDNNPPAIKGYRGIHSFSLTSQNRVFQISPEEVLFRSKNFYFLNDDGYKLPPVLDRGEWVKGTRYHYYDRVSWKGSMWLCIINDDDIWQYDNSTDARAADVTDITIEEGDFPYTMVIGGVTYTGTDHYSKRGKIGNSTVYYIRNYTTTEPSKNASGVWLQQVSKGTEIISTEVAYAASKSGTTHPADDSTDWKTVGKGERTPDTDDAAINATGINDANHTYGVYLWTRKKTYYEDPNNPDRKPTVEYTVVRWGIDANGIYRINSYYLATSDNSLMITSANDSPNNQTYPIWMPSDSGYASANAQHKWYDTFDRCASDNNGVGKMQGWLVWEKTVIKYDKHYNKDGTEDTKADVINYKSSRIGQDGQIGQEEYYMLAASDDFNTVFGSSTPSYEKIGIRWYKQSAPADERWRLSSTTPNINTQMWSPYMPTYDKSTHGAKVYLWNFEKRIDGQGTEYATRPICIGNHARGIKGVRELYALSSMGAPDSGRQYPSDIKKSGTASEKNWWTDEIYDRAPTEELPYQWNWTRTLYSSPKDANDKLRDADTGYYYEDHYHVSAVRGTKGEDGSGVEYIYFLSQTNSYGGTHPKDIEKGKVGGQGDWIQKKDQYKTDDYVPEGWTDNPQGIRADMPYEFVSERHSSATTGTGGFSGSHQWGDFSEPRIWSKWGYNGNDGDGTEYVFIRTNTDEAPVLVENDGGTAANYQSQEWLPYVNGNGNHIETNTGTTTRPRCTDNPKGTTREWPYEWVAKRTMGAPSTQASNMGQRVWKSYYECAGASHKMSRWANYAENAMRLDLSNEMDMVQTDSTGKVTAKRTVTTIATLYDGATKAKAEMTDKADTLKIGTKVPTITPHEDGSVQITWQFAVGDTIGPTNVVEIDFLYLKVPHTAVFTLAASMGQPIYQLAPSFNSINFSRNDKNELTPSTISLGLKILKVDANSTQELTSCPEGYSVRWKYDEMPATNSAGSAWTSGDVTSVSNSTTNTDVCIALFYGNVVIDRETIPILKDGANGDGIKNITRTYAISNVGTTTSDTTEPAHNGSWSASSPAVTAQYPYLWVKEVVTFKYANATTKYYCLGARGANGIDAQDVEYVFARTQTSTPPEVENNNDHDGKKVENDDYTPAVKYASTISGGKVTTQNYATDDPQGVSKELPFEWIAKRTKGNADATTGKRSWNGYPLGAMKLYATYADSPITADLGNEMDSIHVSDIGTASKASSASTRVMVYKGTIPQNFTINKVTRYSLNSGGAREHVQEYSKSETYDNVKLNFIVGPSEARAVTVSYEQGAQMYGTDYYEIEVESNNLKFQLTFTVVATTGDSYEVMPTINGYVSSYIQALRSPYDDTLYVSGGSQRFNLGCMYRKTFADGSGSTQANVPSSGKIDDYIVVYRYRQRSNSSWTDYAILPGTISGENAPNINLYDAVEVVICSNLTEQNTLENVIDRETVYAVADGRRGRDGTTPTIKISDDGYWIINGVKQTIKAEGTDGTGVAIKGEVANQAAREALTGMSKGDCYIQSDNRHLYMWDGATWIDLGEFQGAPGKNSYVHIAYATSITFNTVGTVTQITGFTVDNDGSEYDWWGFCTDNDETDPGRGATTMADIIKAANKYKWNYMKGKDGDGVEYIYLLTKEGFTPLIDPNSYTGAHGDPTKDEFYPMVGNWSSSNKYYIYDESRYWSDDPPASVSDEWPMLWWAKREYSYNASTGKTSWGNFGTVMLHNRWAKNAVRIDLDNENDTMLYSSSKGLISGNVVSTAYLYDGIKDVSSNATWSIKSMTGCTASISWRTITVTDMSDTTGSVVLQAVYNGQTYLATLTLKKIVDGDKYDLVITPNSIAYNESTDYPATTAITVEVWRMSVDGTRTKAAPPTGYATYLLDGSTQLKSSTDSSFTYSSDNSERNSITVKIAKGYASTEYLDCETVPVTKAKNGASGKNGDTPISCYRWYEETLTPTKPTDVSSDEPASADYSGSDQVYPTDKWSKNAPNRPADGWNLWMCQSTKHTSANNTVTRDAWSDPVRISGAKGAPGEDGSDMEYIYILKTGAYNFPADEKPASITMGEVSPGGHAAGGVTQYSTTKDDWVPQGWWDNPRGIDDTNIYEYMSWRRKGKGSNDWGAFSDPIIWSHYGENGMDGDGVEYVFVRTGSNSAPRITNSSDTYDGKTYVDDEYRPNSSAGRCTDDPTGVDENNRYEWVAMRRKSLNADGRTRTWEKYSGTMVLWAKWSEDGEQGADGNYEQRQLARSRSRIYYTAAGGWIDTTIGNSGWVDAEDGIEPTQEFPYIWQRSRTYRPKDGSTSRWGSYICLTGANGPDGNPGKTGLWYRYAGEWYNPVTEVTNSESTGWYVNYGGNWWMNVLPAGQTNNNTPDAGVEGWEPMNSTFNYYIARAYFGQYAHLGSFIINGDWMISMLGYAYWSWGGIAYDQVLSDGTIADSSIPGFAYEYFDPNHPNDDSPGRFNFCPNFAVDAWTGKVYMNDAFVRGNIEASSGAITGNMELGAGADNRKILLQPGDDSNGAHISGWVPDESNPIFDLGFANNRVGNPNPFLRLGYWNANNITIRRSSLISTGQYGDYTCMITIDNNSDAPLITINRAGNVLQLRVDNDGKATIFADKWKTSNDYDDLDRGEVYVENGILKVKQ